jgi:hypothetical protein
MRGFTVAGVGVDGEKQDLGMIDKGVIVVLHGIDPVTGLPVAQNYVDGAAKVTTLGSPGTLETRTIFYNADADCIAVAATAIAGNLTTLDTFTAGKKRCRLTYHMESGAIPFAGQVAITLNAGDDTTAASRLTITDVSEAGTGSVDTRQRFLSATAPVIEYALTGTDSTITRIDAIGYLSAGIGAGNVIISVEVW